MSYHVFGVSSTSNKSHNPVSGLPQGDQGTTRFHLACKFHSGNVGVHSARSRVFASSLQDVGSVERRGVNADQHVGYPGLRLGDLLNF